MKWEYIQPVTIRFGEGIVKEVKDVAASMGCKRGILVSDPFFLTNGLADKIVKDSVGTLVCVYGEVSPNPEVKEVDACAKLIRENDIEFVVALGGGVRIDRYRVAVDEVEIGPVLDTAEQAIPRFRVHAVPAHMR